MTRGIPDVEAMLGLDMAAAVEGARRMAEQAATVQDRIAGLVGRAETPDGRVRLAFSPEKGLPELHIDPRAMRMGSEELAETIQRLVGEALADLVEQKQATAAKDGVEAAAPDPEAIGKTLDGMSDVMRMAARDATALIEQVRARLER
jgi:DNA-binding protein YbaB